MLVVVRDCVNPVAVSFWQRAAFCDFLGMAAIENLAVDADYLVDQV